jgi:hypothetical protein
MLHVCGRREVHTGFWWVNLEERPPRGPGWRWEDKNKRNLKETGWECMECRLI